MPLTRFLRLRRAIWAGATVRWGSIYGVRYSGPAYVYVSATACATGADASVIGMDSFSSISAMSFSANGPGTLRGARG